MDDLVSEVFSLGICALSGLFGGLSLSFFWQPQRLHKYGRLSAGLITGAISISTSLAFGGFLSGRFDLNFSDPHTAMGIGYITGVISIGMIAWVANFFLHREDQDILDVATEIKKSISKEYSVTHHRSEQNTEKKP